MYEFEAYYSFVPFLINVLHNFFIVYFPRAGLVAPGIVGNLEVSDFVPGGVDVFNKVSLGDLLVVEIV